MTPLMRMYTLGSGFIPSPNHAGGLRYHGMSPIISAPESSHALKVAIDEALRCKETGESKTILFGLTGTGYFDLSAYMSYNDSTMTNFIRLTRT